MGWIPSFDQYLNVYSHSVQDEVTAPLSVAFHPHGSKMYCGFHNCIRIFDVTRAGRQSETRSTFSELLVATTYRCIRICCRERYIIRVPRTFTSTAFGLGLT